MFSFHIYKTPRLLKKLYPAGIWRKETNRPVIYLTFDDGPVPIATPYVLDCLSKYSAKATFFCVGDNIGKHPAVMQQVVSAGHTIGNHTHNHLKGWNTNTETYLQNVALCDGEIVNATGRSSRLFRPPYGRISPRQTKMLKDNYDIIMWDVLSGDYNSGLSSESILANIIKSTSSGAIVVFHDSMKALPHLENILLPYMDHFSKKGFAFESL